MRAGCDRHLAIPPAESGYGEGMRNRIGISVLFVMLISALAACGSAETPTGKDNSAGKVETSYGWVRATTGTQDPSMSAAFMVIDNQTDEDVTLVGASSPVAGMAEIHEMVMGEDGAMVMQKSETGLTIAAGHLDELKPGGWHVMLMDLNQELKPGDEVDLTLEFGNGDKLDVTLPVKEFTEEDGHYHTHSPSPSHSS